MQVHLSEIMQFCRSINAGPGANAIGNLANLRSSSYWWSRNGLDLPETVTPITGQ